MQWRGFEFDFVARPGYKVSPCSKRPRCFSCIIENRYSCPRDQQACSMNTVFKVVAVRICHVYRLQVSPGVFTFWRIAKWLL